MRVEAAAISLAAQSQQTTESRVESRLTAGFVRQGDAFNPSSIVAGVEWDSSEASTEAIYQDPRKIIRENALATENSRLSFEQLTFSSTPSESASPLTLSQEDQMKLEVIKRLFEGITGKELRVEMLDSQQANRSQNRSTYLEASVSGSDTTSSPEAAQNSLRFGLDYSATVETTTSSSLSFSAQGKVLTADGKSINLQLNFNLSETKHSSESLSMRLGAALKDPLVINFSGPAAELTSTTWQFDINSDGQADTLYRLNQKSGFLALDKNQNGSIDNGTELFGATSGNGFADLSQYDEDQNGFIDEADAIYQHLKIMVQANDGQTHLFTLQEKQIGALYLGQQATAWDLAAGKTEQLAGQLRSTGIFLTEEGRAGTLQQIDLVV